MVLSHDTIMPPFQGFSLSLAIFYNCVIPSGLNDLKEFEINSPDLKIGAKKIWVLMALAKIHSCLKNGNIFKKSMLINKSFLVP